MIFEEEASFLRTLEKGLKRIEVMEAELVNKTINGEQAFELYDTFGFPLDLTSLIAREKGLSVDETGFKVEMEKQKNRSKADAAKETGDWILVGDDEKTEFVGYDYLEADVKIIKYRKIKQKNKERFSLSSIAHLFMPKAVDRLVILASLNLANEKIFITDTKKENELIVHVSEKLPSDLNASFKAVWTQKSAVFQMDNHSATHLLHAALRQVLGKHVEQKGSLVNEKILRFDFSHFAAMTPEEILKVEEIVNRKITGKLKLDEKRNVPIEKAKSSGSNGTVWGKVWRLCSGHYI